LERTYNLIQFTEFQQGGHFAALERPNEFVADILKFARQIRDDWPSSELGRSKP
jgi:pimeloyl-ACP methyl ester carboxylesterase